MTYNDISSLRRQALKYPASKILLEVWDSFPESESWDGKRAPGVATRIGLRLTPSGGNSIYVPNYYVESFITRLAKKENVSEIIRDGSPISTEDFSYYKERVDIVSITPEELAKKTRAYPKGCNDEKEKFLEAVLGEGNVPPRPTKKTKIVIEVEHKDGFGESWNAYDLKRVFEIPASYQISWKKFIEGGMVKVVSMEKIDE
jgi:hypothetical protein